MGCYHLNTQIGSHRFSKTELFVEQRKLPDKTKSMKQQNVVKMELFERLIEALCSVVTRLRNRGLDPMLLNSKQTEE